MADGLHMAPSGSAPGVTAVFGCQLWHINSGQGGGIRMQVFCRRALLRKNGARREHGRTVGRKQSVFHKARGGWTAPLPLLPHHTPSHRPTHSPRHHPPFILNMRTACGKLGATSPARLARTPSILPSTAPLPVTWLARTAWKNERRTASFLRMSRGRTGTQATGYTGVTGCDVSGRMLLDA